MELVGQPAPLAAGGNLGLRLAGIPRNNLNPGDLVGLLAVNTGDRNI